MAEKSTSATDKFMTILQENFQSWNNVAEGRFKALQDDMREDRGLKVAANLSLLKVKHE